MAHVFVRTEIHIDLPSSFVRLVDRFCGKSLDLHPARAVFPVWEFMGLLLTVFFGGFLGLSLSLSLD